MSQNLLQESLPNTVPPAQGRTYTLTLDQAVEFADKMARAGELQTADIVLRKLLEAHPNRADAQQLFRKIAPLASYQGKVLQLRHTPYMDYPAHVHVETLAVCNAACNFCPYPTLERQGKRMPDDLLQKILRDLQDIPRNVSFLLSPFKVNEPFLDTRLFSLLDEINEKLPNARIALTSNSTPLTEEKLKRLARVRNIEYLWLSVNDHRQEHYEATMKLPFARTIERLEAIHRQKALCEISFPVVLSRVGDKSPADEEFKRWVAERFPFFQSFVSPRGGWLGQVDLLLGPVPPVACGRWYELSITSTGTVAHCCMDGQAKWPIGDVSKQHVLEIYNAPEYRKLRERTMTRLDAEPCRTCTFL